MTNNDIANELREAAFAAPQTFEAIMLAAADIVEEFQAITSIFYSGFIPKLSNESIVWKMASDLASMKRENRDMLEIKSERDKWRSIAEGLAKFCRHELNCNGRLEGFACTCGSESALHDFEEAKK